jgi:hypothetical protein
MSSCSWIERDELRHSNLWQSGRIHYDGRTEAVVSVSITLQEIGYVQRSS